MSIHKTFQTQDFWNLFRLKLTMGAPASRSSLEQVNLPALSLQPVAAGVADRFGMFSGETGEAGALHPL